MSSLKSGALLSLFTGVSFADLQKAATHNDPRRFAEYPAPVDLARAVRFSAPSQVAIAKLLAEATITGELAMIRDAA